MKKEEEEKVEQPSIDAQQIYLSLISNDAEEVGILRTKKKYKIRWLKNGQLEKLSRLLLHKKTVDENTTTGSEVMDAILEDNRLACKAAAIIILDRQYDNIQLHDILEAGKKKVPLNQFYATIMSLTGAKDSLMRMRAKEVEATLHGLNMAARSQTESSDNGL